MADETPESVPIGPFRLATPGDRSWTRPFPWVLEILLVAITVYVLFSDPLAIDHIVAVLGLMLTMVVLALPALVQFAPENRAWTQRTATLWPEGIVVEMPGREPLSLPWDQIARAVTRPLSLGLQIPPWVHLVTDFFRLDGERIAELTVHHSGYSRIGHQADVNEDGPALLAVLERTPGAHALDLASRTFVELVMHADSAALGGLSPGTVDEIRAGRLWHARRAADDDHREAERVPDALILIDCILRRHALATAREAHEERPFDPTVRYYLAHAILAHIRSVGHKDAAAMARRRRLRAEALSLLEGLRGDKQYRDAVARDLRAIDAKTLNREPQPSAPAPPAASEPATDRRPRILSGRDPSSTATSSRRWTAFRRSPFRRR